MREVLGGSRGDITVSIRGSLLLVVAVAAIAAALLALQPWRGAETPAERVISDQEILLPLPSRVTGMSVEEAMLSRKSMRAWRSEPLKLEELSMILWAAQGITEYTGWYRRTAPSAGATYPLEVYVVVGEHSVRAGEGFLEAGVYKYDPLRHSLILVKRGDLRRELWEASLRQDWVRDAPVSLVICAVFERTTSRYGERGVRYVHMEAGHAGQNIYLMVTALRLGTVAVGAFHDEAVARVVNAQSGEKPLYVFPVGVPVEPYTGSFDELGKLYSRTRGG